MTLNTHVKTVCKIGQGAATCRYLLASGSGWHCGKLLPDTKTLLDARVAGDKMKARGDNCEGKSDQFLNSERS